MRASFSVLSTSRAARPFCPPETWPTLRELQLRSCSKFRDKRAFGVFDGADLNWTTYGEFGASVEQFKYALMEELHVQKGSRVAIVGRNSLPWAIGAYGSYAAGAAYVPMYENQGPKEWSYVIQDSGAEVVLCATDAIQKQLQAMKSDGELPGVSHLIGTGSELSQLLASAQDKKVLDPSVHHNDLCGLIYTSGTSGKPKGVELSHGNITSNVLAIAHLFEDIIAGKQCLSFLPWAHAYAQTVELHASLMLGSQVAISGGIEVLRDNLVQAQPDILFSVPSLFEKIHAGVRANVAKQSPLKQRLFHAALDVALQRARLAREHRSLPWLQSLQFKVLDAVVLSKIRQALGPNLTIAVSGGARLDEQVMEFFEALGLHVYEGYGLTETSPIVAANSPLLKRPGTVGLPLPGVTVTIRDPQTQFVLAAGREGEVCVAGPNVFQCYHNLPEATAHDVFLDESGMRTFRTGDLGRLTPEGALAITGRIKEQYKLVNGKYVTPSILEAAICRSPFVDQCMVYGDNLPVNVALVVPAAEALQEKFGVSSVYDDDAQEQIKPFLLEQVNEQCSEMKHYEIPRHVLLAHPFTVENGMATPKTSIRRAQILAAYKHKIEALIKK